MPWSKEDRSFKTLINRRTTSSTKAWYEEFGDNTINVSLGEVWTGNLTSDTSAAVTAGLAEHRTTLTLTEDITVPSQQGYYADESSVRLKDWISEKYGSDYAVELYENDGVSRIYPTDPSDWFWDYQTGILAFNGSTSGFSKPFKISGYRYVGPKGANIGQDATIGGTLHVESDLRVDGTTTLGPFTMPPADGAFGQVITTDGAGTLSWTDQSGGGASLSKETYEILTASINDQTNFYLSYVPYNTNNVRMVPEGGVEFYNGSDYTCTDSTVTYSGSPAVASGERFLFKYWRQ